MDSISVTVWMKMSLLHTFHTVQFHMNNHISHDRYCMNQDVLWSYLHPSGGFRNLEGGVQPLVCDFCIATPNSGHVNAFMTRVASRYSVVRTEQLEATLGLVKCLEIMQYKELIRECATVPGCCCCMPLLHNHLMDSCSYVRKNILLATKGVCICTPPPINPPLHPQCLSFLVKWL